jgi:peptidoglycan/LPS O-acetylase OafA/YrhL
MERFTSGVLAVLWCLGMLICVLGYDSEKMLSFGFWATVIILATVGYLAYLVAGHFKEAKGL